MVKRQEQPRPAVTPRDYAERNRSPSAATQGGSGDGFFDKTAQSVKDRVRSIAEEQKADGAERIGAFGRAVHGAAEELGKEVPEAAGPIHSVADSLQKTSERLREHSVDDLAARLDRFARKQPAAAFASSVLAGFALSRFLKSSNG
jgi:ATP-dependent exoDNAse (exonuclease V) beta subunit